MYHRLCFFVTGCKHHIFFCPLSLKGGRGPAVALLTSPSSSYVVAKNSVRAFTEPLQYGCPNYDSWSPQRPYPYYSCHPGANIVSIILRKMQAAHNVIRWVLVRNSLVDETGTRPGIEFLAHSKQVDTLDKVIPFGRRAYQSSIASKVSNKRPCNVATVRALARVIVDDWIVLGLARK